MARRQVWLAFCKWIVERFDRAKGVNIINLMSLSWEPDELEEEIYGGGGGRALRPVWRLNAAFERGYNLQCKNKADKRTPNDEASFEKMEEINFHKIAMRYSNTLTKDVAFSCLREMFSRLGKAMMTRQHVKVFCGVGDFVCRDRKAEFEFDRCVHDACACRPRTHAQTDPHARVCLTNTSASTQSHYECLNNSAWVPQPLPPLHYPQGARRCAIRNDGARGTYPRLRGH